MQSSLSTVCCVLKPSGLVAYLSTFPFWSRVSNFSIPSPTTFPFCYFSHETPDQRQTLRTAPGKHGTSQKVVLGLPDFGTKMLTGMVSSSGGPVWQKLATAWVNEGWHVKKIIHGLVNILFLEVSQTFVFKVLLSSVSLQHLCFGQSYSSWAAERSRFFFQ